MKAAWLASIIAQVCLLGSLLQAGRRDWWAAYLAADLVRSGLLWTAQNNLHYYWIWTVLQLPLLFLQLAAVNERSNKGPWRITWIYGALALAAWIVAISPTDWPVARQAAIMVWHLGSVVCLSVLIGGASVDRLMRFYYALHSILSALALAWSAPDWAEAIGIFQCVTVTVLFAYWTIENHRRGFVQNGGK